MQNSPKQFKIVSKIVQNNPTQSKTIYTHRRDNMFPKQYPKQSKTISKIALNNPKQYPK